MADVVMQAAVVRDEVLHEAKWVRLCNRHYTLNGKDMAWEFLERTTTEPGGIDAVEVVATVAKADGVRALALVEQFRPPAARRMLEFPAGLIDKGEAPVVAAERELREETGLVGARVQQVRGADGEELFFEPAISSQRMAVVCVDVDGTSEANVAHESNTDFDESECIRTHLVPLPALREYLRTFAQQEGCGVDARLWFYAEGLHAGQAAK